MIGKILSERHGARRAYLAGASLLALSAALALPPQAMAQTTISNSTGIQNLSGNLTLLTITSTGAISGVYGVLDNGHSIGTLINDGSVHGSPYSGIEIGSNANVGILTNNGAISSSSNAGISNPGSGTINQLTNNGIITGRLGISNQASMMPGHVGTIGTLTNNGTISGGSTGITNSGIIPTLSNSGVIVRQHLRHL